MKETKATGEVGKVVAELRHKAGHIDSYFGDVMRRAADLLEDLWRLNHSLIDNALSLSHEIEQYETKGSAAADGDS